MFERLTTWARDMRAVWDELGGVHPKPPVKAQITYYGRLGEMGHPEDRADDWPPCDPGDRR